jgi:hypothetical protein
MEIWKDIEGFSEYEVSDHGRIKSLRPRKSRRISAISNPIIMKQINCHGYLRVGLDNRKKYIHRLIAKAFIPNPENKPFINHKNGVKVDNRIENLEWVTSKENTLHAWENGLINTIGEYHPNSRLSEEDVKFIYQYPRERGYGNYLAKKYKVTRSQISLIIKKKIWTHVTDLL